MTHRMWVAVAAGTLIIVFGTVLIVGRHLHSAEPPPPATPEAQLMQPVPSANEEPSGRFPLSRWPLGAPANHEVPAHEGQWTCPRPLQEPHPAGVQTTSAFAAEPRPVAVPNWIDAPVRPRPGVPPTPLTGTHVAVLDGGYLTVPPALRLQLGDLRDTSGRRQLFVTPDPDGCLWLTTARGLERLQEQLQKAGHSAQRLRQVRRLCFAQTEACPVDRNGRVQIPDHLIRHAGLQQQIALVGVGDRLELWDGQRWHQYVQQATGGVPSQPAQVMSH